MCSTFAWTFFFGIEVLVGLFLTWTFAWTFGLLSSDVKMMLTYPHLIRCFKS